MSNVIKIGNLTIDSFKVGAADCSIYLGTTKLYPQGSQETYTEVEYIENASPYFAYIDTGVAPSQNTRIIADLQYVTTNTHPRAFGCGMWNDVGYIFNAENGIPGEWKWKFGANGNDWVSTSVASDLNRHKVEISGGSLYIDDTLVSTAATSTFQVSDNIGLFGFIYNGELGGTGAGENMFGKYYSCQIYDNGTLVRDFIPVVRDSDSKAGMYDRVNDVFYLSPNGDLFVAGSPVAPSFKYKLTLSNGDIVSAETDATSAITRNEVSAYSATCVSAEIGDTVTSIGGSTFNGFNNLSSVTIGTNVTTINVYAFNRCSGLTEVVIPDSVTYIGGSAFDNCKSISSITLSNNITQIGMGAFRSCLSLQNIVIPSSVTSIEGQAFLFDSSLTAITVNATTPPTLGSDVFLETGNCPIYVPCESVELYKQASGWSSYSSRITCIPATKFTITKYNGNTVDLSKDCDGSSVLSSREFDNTILPSPYYANYINIIEVGDCVESIENTCFNSSYLEQITLPSTLTSIGSGCFNNCPQLTSITCLATTPPTLGSYALTNSNNVQIYVPASAVDTYKAASGWSSYASRIQAIP